MKTFTLESDGSLTLSERGPQLNVFDPVAKAFVPAVDAKGAPLYGFSVVTMRPEQIGKHRRDQALEADLQASADLGAAEKQSLPPAPVKGKG